MCRIILVGGVYVLTTSYKRLLTADDCWYHCHQVSVCCAYERCMCHAYLYAALQHATAWCLAALACASVCTQQKGREQCSALHIRSDPTIVCCVAFAGIVIASLTRKHRDVKQASLYVCHSLAIQLGDDVLSRRPHIRMVVPTTRTLHTRWSALQHRLQCDCTYHHARLLCCTSGNRIGFSD